MKTSYWILRGVGYASGIAAVLLVMMQRNHPETRLYRSAAGILLLVMLACLLSTYALYLLQRLRRK